MPTVSGNTAHTPERRPELTASEKSREERRRLARQRAQALELPRDSRGRAIDGIPELLADSEGLDEELRVIAEALRRVVGSHGLALYVLEADDEAIPPRVVVGALAGDYALGHELVAEAVPVAVERWGGRTEASGDLLPVDGGTVLPIRYRGECVGALAIEHGEEGLPGGARLNDIGNLLGLAALTIANHRLRRDGSRRLAEIQALREVGRIVGVGPSAVSVLEGIFGAAAEILSYDTASLFVVDEAEGVLRLAASRNISPAAARRSRFRIGEGVVGWVIAQERPATVPDTLKDARYQLAGTRRRKPHSLLVVPLRARGRVIAALSFSRHHPNAFSSHDLDLAEVIAAYAAQALEHSRLAKAAAEAESLREGAELLASISHDIRGPLNMMRVVTDLLQRQFPTLDAQQTELLSQIAAASEQLGSMINAALETSRLEASLAALEPTRVRLAELAHSVVSGLAWRAGSQHRLVLDVPPALEVEVDPTQFYRVLANLVDNAIKYSPGGGEVVVRGRRCAEGVRIGVSDQGVGIDPAHVGRLFERFYRPPGHSRPDSFGLGLYICKRIVDAHSGTIGVESAPGRGSEFVVTLP